MSWFKRKTYPNFYNAYTETFKDNSNTFETTRFVVFDTETTGLHPDTDKILSIGCVAVINNKINVADSLELYLKQTQFNADTVQIHGLLKGGSITKVKESDAIIQFLDYIKNAVLVAHHAAFDIAMINHALKRLEVPKLKNKVIDSGQLYKKTKYVKDQQHYSLNDLCNQFNITMHDRHTASGDAYLTALVFLKCCNLLIAKKKRQLRLKDL